MNIIPLTIIFQAASGAGAQSAVGAAAENIVVSLLYQLLIILAMTRIVTWGVKYLGQTDVSGEILAGLLLGPSLLQSSLFGAKMQAFTQALFRPRRPWFLPRYRNWV